MKMANVALVGNPNCGKTALFNALTGSDQRVGNWSGVTVEKKTGIAEFAGEQCGIIDLPGIYSLFSYSTDVGIDEKIASDYLFQRDVDLIVNVVDAANLERHLYLTTQLLDLGLPVVIAVNMMDILERRNVQLDINSLAQKLRCPVVGIVANRKKNITSLKHAIFEQVREPCLPVEHLQLPHAVNKCLSRVRSLLSSAAVVDESKVDLYSMALVENDITVTGYLSDDLKAQVKLEVSKAYTELQEDIDLVVADRRYRWSRWLCDQVLQQPEQKKVSLSERLDQVILNRFLGFPIFLLVIYALFFFAINVGGAFQDFFDQASDAIFVQGVAHLLHHWHAPGWLVALLADGLGKGINTTVTFIPMIAALFFFLSFLEDSGYMARATFLMDRLMRALGLPGEAFVPMIVGFGCNVPAVMGARTLSKPRDRVLTVMMMPFMACSARFAIFTVFATAFFPRNGTLIIFSLYLVGIVAAILTGLVLRKTCFTGASAPLVMELPNYHRPQFIVLCRLMWRRARSFVLRAGKVIVPVCVILGGLNAITISGDWQHAGHRSSVLSVIGRSVTPVLSPMGVRADNWPATVGLATGIMAKEVVIGTLNSLYAAQTNTQETFDLWGSLKSAAWTVPANIMHLTDALLNPIAASAADVSMNADVLHIMHARFASDAAAFSYLLFVLLYFPCVSTLAVTRREIGKRWAYISVGWSFLLAYAVAVLSYQLCTFALHPQYSLFAILALMLSLTGCMLAWRRYVRRAELGGAHVIGS
jgi:ferrous iron transport protein B